MKYTTLFFDFALPFRRKKVYTLITVHSGKVVWKKDQIDNMEEEMKKNGKENSRCDTGRCDVSWYAFPAVEVKH